LFLKTDGAGNLSFSSDLPTTSFTGATAETSIAGGDLVLIYDDSATAVRKMTRTNFVSGIGGNMKPAFEARITSDQTVTNNTITKGQFATEIFDTDSCYDNSTNYRFTPTTAGKYFCYTYMTLDHGQDNGIAGIVYFYKNGSEYSLSQTNQYPYTQGNLLSITLANVISFNGSSDYLEVFGLVENASGSCRFKATANYGQCYFGAYKLIE
jgi:hypothetical protein